MRQKNTPEYNRAYWQQHGRLNTKRVRLSISLIHALACMENEFDSPWEKSGPNGLRAQAIAHLKQALLIIAEQAR